MGTPSRLIASSSCSALRHCTRPLPRRRASKFEPVTRIASADTGLIEGKVIDEIGKPLDGVVISALGGTTAFAVSDKTGQYTLKQLPPGPYLVRAHLQGFLAARSTMVNVRPSARSASSFTLRREGTADAPRVTEAVGGARSALRPRRPPRRPAIATRASLPGACVI